MKTLVELGKEEKLPADQVNKDTTNDNFGLNDQDWEIYKEINMEGQSEAEEQDQATLNDLEERISSLDEKFNMILYQTGSSGSKPMGAEDYQMRLWTDRYRGNELVFQPSIIGVECAGMTEALMLLF